MSEKVRLQKYMASAGVASRRASEKLIEDGRVSVNGAIVREPGFKVEPGVDAVLVDGKPIAPQAKEYILLNKPAGYVCTSKDIHAKKTVFDLIPEGLKLHTVGRLDKDTEGLILLTNDGELTQKLTHPSHETEKTYEAVVQGKLSESEERTLERGVVITEDDGVYRTAEAKVKVIFRGERTSVVQVTIHEGRKRQIRRMFEAVGHPVIELKRIREGVLNLKGLKRGEWRRLTPDEVRRLRGD